MLRYACKVMCVGAGLLGSVLLAAPAWGAGLLVHGESLSAGYGLERGQEWPALLAAQLQRSPYKNLAVDNSSISGETTTGGLARLPAVLHQWPAAHAAYCPDDNARATAGDYAADGCHADYRCELLCPL